MARFEEFWEVACDFRYVLRIAFMFAVFLFVLAVISLLLAQPGTGAYAIALVNFVLISGFGLVVGWVNYVCASRERQYY